MTVNVPDLAVIPVVAAPLIPILLAVLGAVGGALVSILKPRSVWTGLKLLWRRKISVVIIAAGVVGMVYSWDFVFGSTVDVGGSEKGVDWSAYRGGPERSGAVAGAPDPIQRGNVWAFTKDVKCFYSSPAVVGNRVYVASADKGVFTDRGAIYSLDADSGGVVWKYSPRNFRATYSSPSVAAGRVVCGEGLHFTEDARITCLTADKGELVWEHRTNSHVESSPCIYEDRVFIGAGADGLYCIALKPKSGTEANVLWHLPGEKYPDCETSPVAAEGKVFFGLGKGGNAVVCVDAKTGKELWRTPTPYTVFSSPTLAEGKLIVGMGNGDLINTAEALRAKAIKEMRERGAGQEEIDAAFKAMAPAGRVWCLDPKTGLREWEFQADRNIMAAVAYSKGRLYFGTQGGLFHCLTMDGKPVGRPWNARSPINTSAAVGAAHVYFMTSSGVLVGLSNKTLRPKWEMAVATGGVNFVSSPAVARGHVYVGTEADGLLCVGRPSEKAAVPLWAGSLGGPGESGWADGSPLGELGKRGWRYPAKTGAAGASVGAPVAYLKGAVYTSVQDGERIGLAKIVQEKKRRRASAKEVWFYPTPNPIALSAAVRAGVVFVVDGKPGQKGRQLHALNAKDAKVLWQRPVADTASGRMLLTTDRLYVCDQPGKLTCIELGDVKKAPHSRKVAWVAAVKDQVGPPAIMGKVLLVSDGRSVAALNPADGKEAWRADLKAAATTGPVTGHGLIAVGTSSGVSVLSPVGKRVLWTRLCGAVAGPLVRTDLYLACSTPKGLRVFDWAGRRKLLLPDAIAGLAPLLVGETAVYAAAGVVDDAGEQVPTQYIKHVNIPDGAKAERKNWMTVDPTIHGAITTTPVLAELKLFFGTAKRGLICGEPR